MIPRSYPTDSNGRMVVAEVNPAGLKAWTDYIPIQYVNLVACLNFDGTDAATTFTDEAGLTWSATAQAQLDTAQKKYGVASLLCDGTGDYISCAITTNHDLGSGDFTIEGWVRYSAVAAPGSRWVSKWTSAGSLESWKIGYVHPGTLLRFSHTVDGATDVDTDASFAPVAGTWYHFAACRYNNTLTTYIDGVAKGTRDMTGVTIYTANTVTRIGRGDTGSDHNGWLDGVRVVKGKALYTGAFTAPSVPPPGAVLANRTDDAGAIKVTVVATAGLTAWVHYIPVAAQTGAVAGWRTTSAGALQVTTL